MQGSTITLEAARVNAGLTQAGAAEKLNISVATLRNYELGRNVPTWDTVQKMEQVYRWPAAQIFFGRKLAISEKDSEPAVLGEATP